MFFVTFAKKKKGQKKKIQEINKTSPIASPKLIWCRINMWLRAGTKKNSNINSLKPTNKQTITIAFITLF